MSEEELRNYLAQGASPLGVPASYPTRAQVEQGWTDLVKALQNGAPPVAVDGEGPRD